VGAARGGGPRGAIVATLGLAGLRVGELCALDEQHIDLAGGKIHIREAKTGAGIRVIDQTRDRLRKQMLALLGSYAPAEPHVDRGQERLF
jgi:integrase